MAKTKKKTSLKKTILFTLLGLAGLVLLMTLLLRGKSVALLSPRGQIAMQQRRLMIISVLVLLEIAIPTMTLFYYTAWKYRESNKKAVHNPSAHHSKSLVFCIWAIPSIFMLVMASLLWPATHSLAPQKSINNGVKPLTIKVIALRWKWLFIYPEQNIATVNFVQIPINTPIQFELSADETPMSSFWIPQLGGQLYAMTGHVNQLNLIADTTGDFAGSAAEINGAGFAGMKFVARATTMDDFSVWNQNIRQSSSMLDTIQYEKLLKPSEYNSVALYSAVGPDIYDKMLMKYSGSHEHAMEHQ